MPSLIDYYREQLKELDELIRQREVAVHNREGTLEAIALEIKDLRCELYCLRHKATTYRTVIDELSEEV